jgi:hypothetical protein
LIPATGLRVATYVEPRLRNSRNVSIMLTSSPAKDSDMTRCWGMLVLAAVVGLVLTGCGSMAGERKIGQSWQGED